MVRTRSCLCVQQAQQPLYRAHTQRRRHAAATFTAIVTVATALAAIEETWNRLNPEPYHTSVLSGHQWVQELLNGHRDRMKDSLGTSAGVFRRLERELVHLGGLAPQRYINTTEQLAIFLYQAVTNCSIRQAGEHFQRSNETISR